MMQTGFVGSPLELQWRFGRLLNPGDLWQAGMLAPAFSFQHRCPAIGFLRQHWPSMPLLFLVCLHFQSAVGLI
jgi:hypothetical protein